MLSRQQESASHSHTFILDNRQEGTITGVIDVVSFNDKEILLKTVAGVMTIRGENLTLTRLNLEKQETDIQGMVDSVVYSRNRGGKENRKRKRSVSGTGNYTGGTGWLEQLRSWW